MTTQRIGIEISGSVAQRESAYSLLRTEFSFLELEIESWIN